MVFTIYGRGGHLGHVTQMPRTKFPSPYPRRLHIKFGFDQASGFRVWTTYDDDGGKDARRSMGSGELKRQCSLGLYVDRDLQRF